MAEEVESFFSSGTLASTRQVMATPPHGCLYRAYCRASVIQRRSRRISSSCCKKKKKKYKEKTLGKVSVRALTSLFKLAEENLDQQVLRAGSFTRYQAVMRTLGFCFVLFCFLLSLLNRVTKVLKGEV